MSDPLNLKDRLKNHINGFNINRIRNRIPKIQLFSNSLNNMLSNLYKDIDNIIIKSNEHASMNGRNKIDKTDLYYALTELDFHQLRYIDDIYSDFIVPKLQNYIYKYTNIKVPDAVLNTFKNLIMSMIYHKVLNYIKSYVELGKDKIPEGNVNEEYQNIQEKIDKYNSSERIIDNF